MSKRCVHKGCGKTFDDDSEACVYHPGPPEFHEGQKGWKCCKPRVLTFDEFLTIPPCTTGKHSTVDDTPKPEPKPSNVIAEDTAKPAQPVAPVTLPIAPPRLPQSDDLRPKPSASPAPPESESDEEGAVIESGKTCRRRGCDATSSAGGDRNDENCVHHPGQPVFHEGSKGWSCCKKRVLDFDEFMQIEGCKNKRRHLFVGSGKNTQKEETLETVRHDFYQTPNTVIASLFLKKIDKQTSTIEFSSPQTIALDLKTSDKKRYRKDVPLFGKIDTEKSTFKILGTKVEFSLAKADGVTWPVLRSDDPLTGEIIQSGKAGRV